MSSTQGKIATYAYHVFYMFKTTMKKKTYEKHMFRANKLIYEKQVNNIPQDLMYEKGIASYNLKKNAFIHVLFYRHKNINFAIGPKHLFPYVLNHIKTM